MKTSSKSALNAKKIARVMHALGQPARIRILLTIGHGEVCVCHLETALGLRQAYISQHLMALREAGLVSSRREGRFIQYRLKDQALVDLIQSAARLAGIPDAQVQFTPPDALLSNCPCPHCTPEESLIFPTIKQLKE
ncbi:MAG: helix-turn-helix transcriptional regulator [Anaerolineales bacterium]|nr:helix-turn-helix transcriptional regulator [Anaerolineales bacterium]